MPLVGHAGNSKLNKPISFTSLLEEFKEAASHKVKLIRRMAKGLHSLSAWVIPCNPPTAMSVPDKILTLRLLGFLAEKYCKQK